MRLAIWSIVATFLLDQLTKLGVVFGLRLIDRGNLDVFPPYLTFRMAWNTGVNFGLFSHDADVMRWVLIAVALAISVWVWVWTRREAASKPVQISTGLLIGGALGNVVDRVVYGAVADFLNVSCCGIENPYAFNVADVAIFAGAIGLVVFSGRGPESSGPDSRRKPSKTP